MEALAMQDDTTTNLAGRYLTIALGTEHFGIPLLKVQEIMRLPSVTRMPNCPAHIEGVINLRGAIVPIADLRRAMEMGAVDYDEKACVIVLNLDVNGRSLLMGIIVDMVLEVTDLKASDIELPPAGINVEGGYVLGLGRKEKGNLSILLDVDRLFGDREFCPGEGEASN